MSATKSTSQVPSPRRVAFASGVGTAIEWYDFFIFNTAAALVFGRLFFPTVSPTAGTLAAFATFGVAFVARPVGGIVFGHFGDRLGRKKMLVLSLLIMGLSTFAIGLLPSYAVIGIMAPILLVVLRFLQGFAVGGEWGGAVLMASESAPKHKRGFYASWPQAGVPAGLVLGTGLFILIGMYVSDEQFLAWGWRIPFLLSAVLIIIGLYIRLRIMESPAFAALQERNRVVKLPVATVFQTSWKQLLCGIGSCFGPNLYFYVVTVLALNYVTTRTEISRDTVLMCVLLTAVVYIPTIPLIAKWSDRVGRKPLLIAGAVIGALLAFPFFALLDSGRVPLIMIAFLLAIPVVHGLTYAPQASFLAELFDTRVRYTGSSITYQVGGMVSSGPTPFVAAALLAWAGGPWPVSIYLIAGALIAILSVSLAPETYRRDTDTDDANASTGTISVTPSAGAAG